MLKLVIFLHGLYLLHIFSFFTLNLQILSEIGFPFRFKLLNFIIISFKWMHTRMNIRTIRSLTKQPKFTSDRRMHINASISVMTCREIFTLFLRMCIRTFILVLTIGEIFTPNFWFISLWFLLRSGFKILFHFVDFILRIFVFGFYSW